MEEGWLGILDSARHSGPVSVCMGPVRRTQVDGDGDRSGSGLRGRASAALHTAATTFPSQAREDHAIAWRPDAGRPVAYIKNTSFAPRNRYPPSRAPL